MMRAENRVLHVQYIRDEAAGNGCRGQTQAIISDQLGLDKRCSRMDIEWEEYSKTWTDKEFPSFRKQNYETPMFTA